jgi:hypothetical protein
MKFTTSYRMNHLLLPHPRHFAAVMLLFLAIASGCNRDALVGTYPADGDRISSWAPGFSWTMEDPAAVRFVLKESENNQIVLDTGVMAQSLQPTLRLKPDTKYTWELKTDDRRFKADFSTHTALASLGSQLEGAIYRVEKDSIAVYQITSEPGFLNLNLVSNSLILTLSGAKLKAAAVLQVDDPASLYFEQAGGDPYNYAKMTISTSNIRDLNLTLCSGSKNRTTLFLFYPD